MKFFTIYVTLFLLIFTSCNHKTDRSKIIELKQESVKNKVVRLRSLTNKLNVLKRTKQNHLNWKDNRKMILNSTPPNDFVNIKALTNQFDYDIKYATRYNFLKQAIYDCDACYIRFKTALALIKANNVFLSSGYRLKFYDCYRPHDAQIKMWKIYPNPNYISNPKKGSIHNRGGAVDVTLIDLDGKEMDMGSPFDYFGMEAHRDYNGLTDEVKKNRELLTNTMKEFGFWTIRTEWWHFSDVNASRDSIENFKWECNE